ncbi:DNA primase [Companilactobacillus baiquanensis]|uniref:DNA primase n=1 Tax=Companilactobacillus baiquanensis TaxID=2486005 RepID=A0ABW1US84_9LACO|nr:DNA primase [Companilactobacillus baiquanensis]
MATRIPQEFIDEVTSKTNIVDVLSKYVQLKKAGKNFVGLCPFHEERTPSFTVTEEKQFFHCFSCGRGGNVYKFIMEMESKSFPEAVIEVAKMGNIPIPDSYQTENTNYQNSDSRTLLKMYEETAKLYNHILLKTENGSGALKYLNQREIDNDLIKTFNLGYAPNNSDLLLQFFKDRSISEDILRKSGLFAENEDGQLFDRFRDRMMVPITDEAGNVVAFSGRILDKNASTAKYLNSPETEIFSKSKVLFNLSNAKKSIRDNQNVILFEGFMDVLSAYKAGVKNGVASMGTSLTDQQLYTLSRLTNQINICYDGDDPGVEATYRALTQLSDERFTYGVISVPDQKDPDEYIRSEGFEKFNSLVKNGVQTPISFILNYFRRHYNLNNEHDQLEFLNQSLQEIVKLSSPVEIDMYVGKVADEMNVSKESINKELDSLRRSNAIKQPANNYKDIQKVSLERATASVRSNKFDRIEKSERCLLYWTLNFPELKANLKGNNFHFVHDNYQKLYESLLAFGDINNNMEMSDFMNGLDDGGKNLLAELEMMKMPQEYSEQEIEDYISNINNYDLESQVSEINQQLKQAAMVGDNKLQLELTKQLIDLRKLLTSN